MCTDRNSDPAASHGLFSRGEAYVAFALAIAILSMFVSMSHMKTTVSDKMEDQRDEHRVHVIVSHVSSGARSGGNRSSPARSKIA